MDLGVTVVTGCYAIIRAGRINLFELKPSVMPAGFGKTRLQESATATATEIIGPIGRHVSKILFADHRLHHKPEIFGDRVPQGLPDQLAGILHGKCRLQIPVPVGIDLQLAFADPLRVILDNAFNFKFMLNLELVQSDPD